MSRIFNLSEAASIAIHSMILITQSEKMINVQHIAEKTRTSKNHVAKILQVLVKNGYIRSNRGPAGGFSIKKDPATINLLEIYETVEGKIEITDCPMHYELCAFDNCIMNNFSKKMTIEFRDYLVGQTLDKYIGIGMHSEHK
jgi:Rrf2 family protein